MQAQVSIRIGRRRLGLRDIAPFLVSGIAVAIAIVAVLVYMVGSLTTRVVHTPLDVQLHGVDGSTLSGAQLALPAAAMMAPSLPDARGEGDLSPFLGFGTRRLRSDADKMVVDAFKAGYRVFETGSKSHPAYRDGIEAVGRALQSVLHDGPSAHVGRGDVFLMLRLHPSDYGTRETPAALAAALGALGVDGIDLVLLDAASCDALGEDDCARDPAPPEAGTPAYIQAARALLRAKERGVVKGIGVASFGASELESLRAVIDVEDGFRGLKDRPPLLAAEARYCSPYVACRQWAVTARGRGAMPIALQAVSNKYVSGSSRVVPGLPNELLQDEAVRRVATRHRAGPGAVVVAWALKCGLALVVTSSDPSHIRDNAKGATLQLSDDDLELLATLDRATPWWQRFGRHVAPSDS